MYLMYANHLKADFSADSGVGSLRFLSCFQVKNSRFVTAANEYVCVYPIVGTKLSSFKNY